MKLFTPFLSFLMLISVETTAQKKKPSQNNLDNKYLLVLLGVTLAHLEAAGAVP